MSRFFIATEFQKCEDESDWFVRCGYEASLKSYWAHQSLANVLSAYESEKSRGKVDLPPFGNLLWLRTALVKLLPNFWILRLALCGSNK